MAMQKAWAVISVIMSMVLSPALLAETYGQEERVEISLQGPREMEVAPGSDFEIVIEIETAAQVAGGQVRISFDGNAVRVKEVVGGDFGDPISNISNDRGSVSIAAAKAQAVEGSILAVVKFQAVKEGDTKMVVADAMVNDEQGNLLNTTWGDPALERGSGFKKVSIRQGGGGGIITPTGEVSLDKDSYSPGDDALLKTTTSPLSDVIIVVFGPDAEDYLTETVQADSKGNVAFSFKVPTDAIEGMWTAVVTTGDDILDAEFKVAAKVPSGTFAIKQIKGKYPVVVKNTGDVFITSLSINTDRGDISFVKVLGKEFFKDWERARVDDSTVTLTSSKPLLPGKFMLIFLTLNDGPVLEDTIKGELGQRAGSILVETV